MEDYGALHAYGASEAAGYDDTRFATWRGRLVDRLEWRLVFRGLSVLMARTGRLTSVVDIPAGTGRMTMRLRRSGLRVIAVDASADMLSVAEARGAADEYLIGRIECLSELVASADCVVSLRLFGHLPVDAQAAALRQVREVTRFGAVICYAADTPLLRLRRALEARRGRTRRTWTPVTDRLASEMARTAGFEVVKILRLSGPVSETHALVLRPLAGACQGETGRLAAAPGGSHAVARPSAFGGWGCLRRAAGRAAAKLRFSRIAFRSVPQNRYAEKAKARAGAWLRPRPRLFWALVPLGRSAQRLSWRLWRLLCRPPKDRFLRPDRLLWVSPSDIVHCDALDFDALRNRGHGWVFDGEWDALGNFFTADPRYRSVKDVLVFGSRWQETEAYAQALADLEKGLPHRHCWTTEELDQRYDALDDVVETIRSEGYLTQRELFRRRTPAAQLGRGDEISVSIGRHGDILYHDGAHRLAIAKLLGVDLLPVEVVVRHSGWMEIRWRIERHATAHGGRVPQPLLHPDLNDIPATEGCEARLQALLEALPGTRTVLDLAPGWGFFCQRLESEGVSCTALEPSPDAAGFLTTLRRAGNRAFDILTLDGLDSEWDDQRAFDAGLLMSDGLGAGDRPSLARALAALASVEVRQVFVEPDAFAGRAAAPGDAGLSSASVLAALAEATGLHASSRLGWSAEAGPLYRLH